MKLTGLIFCLFIPIISSADTLLEVQERGYLRCGVSQSLPGFSYPDDNGNWTGLDVDICKAVAVAIFQDPEKIHFTPTSAKERFTALQSGEIDILSRNTTWTLSRDTTLGLEFTNITYYDGQGFMVRKNSNITTAKQLSGATLCTNTGTTTELNIADYFRTYNMTYELVAFEKADEVVAAYDSGRCDAYTTDRSGLAAQRVKLRIPSDHIILPEIISKEPLAVAVRQNDKQWIDLVRWVIYGLIAAEELRITSKNVEMSLSTANPNIKRLLGIEGALGESIGLNKDFMIYTLKHLGNYAEIFDRNLGKNSELRLRRGLNALWDKGGLMYAPPFR